MWFSSIPQMKCLLEKLNNECDVDAGILWILRLKYRKKNVLQFSELQRISHIIFVCCIILLSSFILPAIIPQSFQFQLYLERNEMRAQGRHSNFHSQSEFLSIHSLQQSHTHTQHTASRKPLRLCRHKAAATDSVFCFQTQTKSANSSNTVEWRMKKLKKRNKKTCKLLKSYSP